MNYIGWRFGGLRVFQCPRCEHTRTLLFSKKGHEDVHPQGITWIQTSLWMLIGAIGVFVAGAESRRGDLALLSMILFIGAIFVGGIGLESKKTTPRQWQALKWGCLGSWFVCIGFSVRPFNVLHVWHDMDQIFAEAYPDIAQQPMIIPSWWDTPETAYAGIGFLLIGLIVGVMGVTAYQKEAQKKPV